MSYQSSIFHLPFSIGLLLLLLAAFPAASQTFSPSYQFTLPATDTAAAPFLPLFPSRMLGPADFVSIGPDGHFAANGRRIRFFGANCVADGAFPSRNYSWFIAGRLRKMGFNLVRFHHMDNPWSGSLFYNQPDTRHLNPDVLDRLDLFLAELKKNSVYADINLHVSRTFRQSDGVPYADSLGEFAKGFTIFDPLLIRLEKEYARQLLTHVNPYTGLSLANDPVMAMVEITNENSIFRFWNQGLLKPFSAGGMLPMYHERLLDSLWNSFLTARYGTTTALASAWNSGLVQEGDNVVANGNFESVSWPGAWSLEVHAPAQASMARDVSTSVSPVLSARVTVQAGDGLAWHAQFKQTSLSVVKDSSYTIRFAAKSDSARTIDVTLMLDVDPWTSAGGASVKLDTAWRTYALTVHAVDTWPLTTRLSFGLGAAKGTFWFDDVVLARSGLHGLLAGETLEDGTVRRIDYAECGGFTDPRVRDMTAFYIRLQSGFFLDMRSYLRDSLGVRVSIVGTALNYGLPDVASQSVVDYMDNHAYWDHPSFPNQPWSATDWNISNTAMVRADYAAGTIGYLFAGVPVAGKPFTVSEYDHPFPNRYGAEGPIFLAAYASLHQADAIMFFDYGGGTDWITDWVSGYFEYHRNTAKMSLMPSLAAAFRGGLIAPAAQTIAMQYTQDDILLAPRYDSRPWYEGGHLAPAKLALLHGVRAASFNAGATTLPPPEPVPPYVSDTREITWNPAGALTVGASGFAAATGFPAQLAASAAGDLAVRSSSDHATLTWLPLDGRPLATSRRSLLTVSTRIQNTGMVWDGTTTIHDRWGTAPTLMQPVALGLALHLAADSLLITPLSETGDRRAAAWTVLPADTNTFLVNIDQTRTPTPWFGIEAFGAGAVTGVPRRSSAPPRSCWSRTIRTLSTPPRPSRPPGPWPAA